MTQALEQLTVGPDDGEAFEEAAGRLTDEFAAWLSERGLDPDDAWVGYQFLQAKWVHIDGALTRWTAGDLHEALLFVFPRKVMIDPGDADRLVPAVGAFVDFLDARDLLDDRGDDRGQLRAVLEAIADEVPAAVCDPSRFGLAKSIFTAMAADGVDVGDPEQVDAWIAAHNAALRGEPAGEPEAVPPVDLPDDEALAETARTVPLVRQLRELLDSPDERVEADVVSQVALAAELVRQRGSRVTVTPRGRALLSDPLELWAAVVMAHCDVGLLGWRAEDSAPWWTELLDTGVEELLCALYVAGSVQVAVLAETAAAGIAGSVKVAVLAETAAAGIAAQADASLPAAERDRLPSDVARGVGALVDRLAWLGVVERRDADAAGCPPGDRVALTALGDWYTHPLIEERGHAAPLADDWARASAAALLEAAAQWPVERADAAVRRWARDRAQAVEELTAAVCAATDIGVRVTGLEAVAGVADDPEAAVRRLSEEPAMRPLATLWLIDRGLVDSESLELEDIIAVMVEQIWCAPTPSVPLVLDALAGCGDKKLAKAARRARFKLDSAR